DSWSLNPVISYNELLYYLQQSSTYWDQRGYSFFDELDIARDLPFSDKKNRSATIALNNSFTLSPAVQLDLSGKFVRHFDLNIPWQTVSHEGQLYAGIYTRPQELHFSSERGSRYRLTLGLSQTINTTFSQDRKSTRLHSSHVSISYAVCCLKN